MTQRTKRLTNFEDELVTLLPRLNRYALKLTRDAEAAKDLLQATVTRAVAKQALFHEGSVMGWLITLMRHEISNSTRRFTPITVDIGKLDFVGPEDPSIGLLVRDMKAALRSLPEQTRRCVMMAAEGWSYESIAAHEASPLGTVKSRINRGRDTLRRLTERD